MGFAICFVIVFIMGLVINFVMSFAMVFIMPNTVYFAKMCSMDFFITMVVSTTI